MSKVKAKAKSKPARRTAPRIELVYLDENFDTARSLSAWIAMLNRLRREHGNFAKLRLDAGYNNVSGVVIK